jgi:hypothetical protein
MIVRPKSECRTSLTFGCFDFENNRSGFSLVYVVRRFRRPAHIAAEPVAIDMVPMGCDVYKPLRIIAAKREFGLRQQDRHAAS